MHEAGHILYATRLGAHDFVIHGTQRRNGRGFSALVEPIYEQPTIHIADSALYLSAGGAAARTLTSDSIGGDSSDLEDFITRASTAGVPPPMVLGLWTAAREVMEAYFTLPEVRSPMYGLAARVETKIDEANKSPERKTPCAVSELIELPLLLQLLDRHSPPA